jgi:hypothetical protein
MREAISPFPQYVFMVWSLFKHRDNLPYPNNVTHEAIWVGIPLRDKTIQVGSPEE